MIGHEPAVTLLFRHMRQLKKTKMSANKLKVSLLCKKMSSLHCASLQFRCDMTIILWAIPKEKCHSAILRSSMEESLIGVHVVP
jgi:hypothetical protein